MHVCLFDIDGTLLNSGGAGQAAMEAAIAELFAADRPVEGISTAGRTDRGITTELFDYYGVELTPERWQQFVECYLMHLPRHLSGRSGLVLPGVVELLGALSLRDDILLGLLTGNFRDGARLKLEHFELAQHFRFGAYGDDHHDRDDVARIALREVEQIHPGEVDLERVWVIGDTPADIQCARAIGAKAVAVATGVYPYEELQARQPDFLFADFSDPAGVLALWS